MKIFRICDLLSPAIMDSIMELNFLTKEKMGLFIVVSGHLIIWIQMSLGSAAEDTAPGLFDSKSAFLTSITLLILMRSHFSISSIIDETPSHTPLFSTKSLSRRIRRNLGRCGGLDSLMALLRAFTTCVKREQTGCCTVVNASTL